MFQSAIPISSPYARESPAQHPGILDDALNSDRRGWVEGLRRRWQRERRRRKVGRAYDMALEIARYVPINSRILDVGCGNGFIAHHLSSMIGTHVIGIDLAAQTEAAIDYRQFDGRYFPVEDGEINAALLCYVLHHAQDLDRIMSELRRVLSDGGVVIVYEDIPAAAWDRLVCWTHDFKWRRRTGPCSFRNTREWHEQFNAAGFEILQERGLSRWRNLAHPVSRRLYVLRKEIERKELFTV